MPSSAPISASAQPQFLLSLAQLSLSLSFQFLILISIFNFQPQFSNFNSKFNGNLIIFLTISDFLEIKVLNLYVMVHKLVRPFLGPIKKISVTSKLKSKFLRVCRSSSPVYSPFEGTLSYQKTFDML